MTQASSRDCLYLSVLALILVMRVLPNAQVRSNNFTPPRTPWGDPDLQGIFNTATVTPFERPPEFAGKEFLTENEAAEFEAREAARVIDAPPRPGDPGTYNLFWWFESGMRVVSTRRTSLVIDPPDGHIPPLTETAQRTVAVQAEVRRAHAFDGPENRPVTERCLWWGTTGPPIIPTIGYNNNYRIAQGPGYVLLLAEMIHDARIIPLDDRPHLSPNVRQWLGDSRGHWEGNTLVVETTNFNDEIKAEFGRPGLRSVTGIGDHARLVERFTRSGKDTLIYEFTVDDSATYTRPWTAQTSWRKVNGPIFEYGCHEGNYGMENILRGARQTERTTGRDK